MVWCKRSKAVRNAKRKYRQSIYLLIDASILENTYFMSVTHLILPQHSWWVLIVAREIYCYSKILTIVLRPYIVLNYLLGQQNVLIFVLTCIIWTKFRSIPFRLYHLLPSCYYIFRNINKHFLFPYRPTCTYIKAVVIQVLPVAMMLLLIRSKEIKLSVLDSVRWQRSIVTRSSSALLEPSCRMPIRLTPKFF